MTSLSLTLDGPRVAAGLEDRSITGVALPYREIGRTNVGAVSVAPGAIRMPADLGAVKLFTDHGRHTPVGYATAADDSPDRLDMTFHVAGTPAGDTALLEAAERVRDSLSVELSDVTIKAGVIVAASLDAVALVALPAYRSARLMLAADTDPDDDDGPAAVEVAVTVTESAAPDTPDDDETVDADPDDEEKPPVTTHPPAPPASSTAVVGADPAARIAAGVARLSAVMSGAADAAQVNAALTDIVPANDPAQGYLRQQWVDELWTPYYAEQFLSNSVTQAPLTGSKVVGWRWKTLPTVGPYAGSKAAIPSSGALLEAATADPYRIAGGWDVDRIFTDLGTGDFVGAVLDAASIDASRKMESAVAASLLAAAVEIVTTATDPFGRITAVVAKVISQGATPTFVAVAPDVFAAILAAPNSTAPWWLINGPGGTVSITGRSGTIADLAFGVSSGLPAGGILAGDRRAMTHYQSPNIRVQALNIPNGGIDIGLFLYAADLVHNANGLAKDVTTP